MERVAKVGALVVALIGALAVFGWYAGVWQLTAVLPGHEPMRPNTAVALVAMALAAAMLDRGRRAMPLGVFATALGCVTLLEYLLGRSLGIDVLLPGIDLGSNTPRMALATAVSLVLLGSAVIAATLGRTALMRGLALAALGVSQVALLGYAYGVSSLYTIAGLTSMAAPTALSLAVLAVSILLLDPSAALVSLFRDRGSAGRLARLMTPFVCLAPFLMGWLRLWAQGQGWIDTSFGEAARVMSMTLIGSILIWRAALSLRDLDGERDDAVRSLAEANRTLESTVTERTRELAQRQGFLDALLETIEVGIVSCDEQGRVLVRNRAERKMAMPDGTVQGLLDETVSKVDFLELDGRPLTVGQYPLMRALRGEDLKGVELQVGPAGGPFREVVVRGGRIIGADNEVMGAVVSLADVTTERTATRLLAAERENIDRFFALSLDLMCIAGADGFFKHVNPAWKEVLGYDPDELLERPFMDFFHPDDREATAAEVAKLMDGVPTVGFENRVLCKDGSYRWLLWRISPLPDQGLMYCVGRDNTDRKRVQQESARLAAIVNSSVDAIVGASIDGTVTSWNRGAEQIFGYRPEEIVGQPVRVLTPPEDHEQDDLLARVARGDIIAPYEASGVRQDGQLIEVALTTSPVQEPDGTIVGISIIARDISEANRTAEAFRAIIATASDGFVSMDADGLITEWNQRAEALFGWPRDEAIGRKLAALIIPKPKRGAHRAGLHRVLGHLGGESGILDQRIEVVALHRDGREIPIELAVWRVWVGQSEQFSAFMRDISERQQIARDVAAARDQAVEASRLKSAFLATMSHEIRTPMNGVIGLTGLLLTGDLDHRQRRYAEGIRTAGDALLAVINDILDFSKIEAGALILDDAAVNLSSLLDNVMELMAESARNKGLELIGYCDPDLPILLRGDPVRIRQILLNLASNAVKFTAEGEVFVHILRGGDISGAVADPDTEPQVAEVRFEVSDTGMGIKPADRARLFDAFAQADASTTRRFGGTGLGLAICRELTEAMGGQVGVESQPGEGSTFWCTIPLRTDPAGHEVPIAPDASLVGRRVLVVDDNDTNRLILTQQLRSWKMLPTAVASGEAAMDHLNETSASDTSYDLGIVDMHMPGINGLELARRIKARRGIPPLPLILVTSGDSVNSETAREANIVACLSKPVPPSELYNCLLLVAAGHAHLTPAGSVTKSASLSEPPVLGSLLLVEDNEINQMVAAGILTQLGYGVDIASDGVQALEMVAGTTYEAVLMDCQMPNMDGYETTEELRRREHLAKDLDHPRDPPLPRLPIIAMTAAALKEDRARCLTAGMDDYLTKPIQPGDLASALIRWTAHTTSASLTDFPEQGSSREQAITSRLDVLRDNGPDGLVTRLVTRFLNRKPDYLTELAEALHRQDCDAFTLAAHTLNGASGNLGASTVAALSHELETLGRDEQLQAAPELLDRLRVEYDRARRILESVGVRPAASISRT